MSSRTFPGKSCVASAATTPGESAGGSRPSRAAICARKSLASTGMSGRRSRSGGTLTSMTWNTARLMLG